MATVTARGPSAPFAERGHRILVCLDRSALSQVCMPYASSLARTFGSAVTLVHVLSPHPEPAGAETHDPIAWEISRQEARGYLERLALELAQSMGGRVAWRLEEGRAGSRIVELARELEVDLIVLGSHGEGGVTAGRLGSTTQEVLSGARRSVLVVPSFVRPAASARPVRILVPLDGSARAESVLPTVARMASVDGAEVLLVHVVQEPLRTAFLEGAEEMALAHALAARLEAGAERYLAHLREQLTHDGLAVRTLVERHASPHQGLIEVAEREGIDLAVVSAHGSACDAAQAFGSVAGHLLTHPVVPLLVHQDLPDVGRPRAHAPEEELAPRSLRASYAPERA